MTASAVAPYEALCELAEYELELVGEGRFDEVAALDDRRARLIKTLPSQPPVAARASLERCALLERRVNIELLRAREALMHELSAVARGQRAASGYKPPNLALPRVTASA